MKFADKEKIYLQSLQQYLEFVSDYKNELYPHAFEAAFESMADWSVFMTLKEVKKWFTNKQKTSTLSVENIPLNETNGWLIDKDTGNIRHASGDFFTIHGVRTTTSSREVYGGWDQPIIEQIGYDGGLLGIIRKRFCGRPHYLCEAKEEPGNYGKVQISPSLQATFANIKQSHQGRRPRFVDLFENRYIDSDTTVLFDSWLAEDGGRLYLKRNKGILVEVKQDIPLPNDSFIWLSLYQIKQLMNENAWINPHIRGILAHV